MEKYDLMRFIRLEHELTHATYEEKSGKWHFKIRRSTHGKSDSAVGSAGADCIEEIEDSADLFISATGCAAILLSFTS